MERKLKRFGAGLLCLCLCLALLCAAPPKAGAESYITKILAQTSYTPVALMDVGYITATTTTPGVYITQYAWFDANTGAYIKTFGTGRVEISITLATHDGFVFPDEVAVYLNNSPAYYTLSEDHHYLTLTRYYDPMIWAPSVIKDPGDEYVDEGGIASFVAAASYAEAFNWIAVNPETGEARSVYTIPEVIDISSNGEQSRMNIYNTPAWMDGWEVYCVFVGAMGSTSVSTRAALHVRALNPAVLEEPEDGEEAAEPEPSPEPSPEPTPEPSPEPTPEPTPAPTPEPAHVHVFSEAWSSDGEKHWRECDCGERIEQGAHEMAWETVRRATKSEPGLERGQCKVCGYTTTRELPYTGMSQTLRFALTGAGGLAGLTAVVLLVDTIVGRVKRRRNEREARH